MGLFLRGAVDRLGADDVLATVDALLEWGMFRGVPRCMSRWPWPPSRRPCSRPQTRSNATPKPRQAHSPPKPVCPLQRQRARKRENHKTGLQADRRAEVFLIGFALVGGRQGGARKQRHTAKRIFDRLLAEYGFTGGYRIVKDCVRSKKRSSKEMFVPPPHPADHVLPGQATAQQSAPQRCLLHQGLPGSQERSLAG